MPKKIISFLCICVLLFSLAGCSQTAFAETQGDNPITPSHTTTESSTEASVETEQTEPVQEETESTEPTVETIPVNAWTPLCNEYIYLRSKPGGGEILSKIPLGALLTFEKWSGKHALVSYQDMQGYVTANYIKPANADYFAEHLNVISPTCLYSYQQLMTDIAALQAHYPDWVHTDVIGKSELGRKISVLIIGNPNSKHHVLMQGAMHGREHFTAWLLMAIADYALSQNHLADEDICYHIIPMVNPDGVTISQSRQLNAAQKAIYQSDMASNYTTYSTATYAEKWKANALGIDLNRNFPSGWEVSKEHPLPSSERYRGSMPLSAAESAALADYTLRQTFHATLSFHSHGSVIYYRYGKKEPVNSLSYSFALAMEQVTGYVPIQYDGTTGAGYKDWAMDALGIPSLTLEIGSSKTPLEERDMYNTFARFTNIIPAINQWFADTF